MDKNPSFNTVCVIGGSGFYDLLEEPKKVSIETPFDTKPVIFYQQDYQGKDVYFLPRHGINHSIPPHKINYKSNIFAIYSLGIPRVISTCAVGSLRISIKPGDYIILDQFIDFVRPITFFDGEFSIEISEGIQISGVVHLDMTEPYCKEVQNIFTEILRKDPKAHLKGTYLTTQGPRFETPAEIKIFKHMNADVVGMTNSSEAILCRELGICYGAIAVVTNMAAGLQRQVSHKEVLDIFKLQSTNLKQIIREAIERLPKHRSCTCSWYID